MVDLCILQWSDSSNPFAYISAYHPNVDELLAKGADFSHIFVVLLYSFYSSFFDEIFPLPFRLLLIFELNLLAKPDDFA